MKNDKKILIDVGSSTVKVYKMTGNRHELLFTKSIAFKKDFDSEQGISEESKNELVSLLSKMKDDYKDYSIKIYATAIFRKPNKRAKVALIDEIYHKTGLFFNIISHELEGFYLELALTGQYESSKELLLVNIGGGSTELVIMKDMQVTERHNIELGIGTILSIFPGINNDTSDTSLSVVIERIKERLPLLRSRVKEAFYNGGELKYMQLVGYNLEDNNLFGDIDHPSIIFIKDFQEKNKEVFGEIGLEQLENLMPEDPKWMHGARACSAIAQAIFEKYGIELIIPSNSNLIDGVIRREFRNVTISGSFRKHLAYILEVKKYFNALGVEVLSPRFNDPKNPGDEFVIFEGEEDAAPIELERYHLESISNSDALIVCNPKGYVGASSLIEIGYAQSQSKRIIFTENPEEYMLNILPAEIGI